MSNTEYEGESDSPLYSSRWDNGAGVAEKNMPNEGGYSSKWTSSDMVSVENDNASPSFKEPVENPSNYEEDLPMFANDANVTLHRQIKLIEKNSDNAMKTINEHGHRIDIMREHLNSVKQEIAHTDVLVAAKMKELQTEKHLNLLEERKNAVLLSEIKSTNDELEDERIRWKDVQSRILNSKKESEKLKLALNWNQEELEQWAAATTRKEEDNLALQRFTRADDMKTKELSLCIENLTKMLSSLMVELGNETSETEIKQMEIEIVSDSFKSHHAERTHLVQQWQDTVKAMEDRDTAVARISSSYLEMVTRRKKRMEQLTERRGEMADIQVSQIRLENLVKKNFLCIDMIID